MLTTISIDLVGTHYINKLHYFGRNIGDWFPPLPTRLLGLETGRYSGGSR